MKIKQGVLIMKCQICQEQIKKGQGGYLAMLDDAEQTRLKELKLKKGENLCISCKRELLFAELISVIF